MNNIEYLKKYGDKDKLEENLKRLEAGEPVQYIVGNVDFYGLTFKVDNRVLIPRFETEQLVEKTLKLIDKDNLDILDIGTGSGCIAITLKNMLPNANVDACDISQDALEVAKSNAKLNNSDINFIHSDLFSNIDKKYDLIISNPPYIAYDEEIDEVVKNNEPHIALYADDKGTHLYKEIFKQALNHLNDKYILAFEIGYMQGEELIIEAQKYFKDANIYVEKDLADKDRYLFIIKR
ncbi:MAG: peptide chain release factor N(5)-glutamine methyltransferase [Bacilli bacterium]|nr:peptide chain release factor N(5)-glutamine methyltransferase [Bacilli bacterium]